MLRGRDYRPAFEFLKKYSIIVAPIDSINSSNSSYKQNGQGEPQLNGYSPFVFLTEQFTEYDQFTEKHKTTESFKTLIQTLSTVNRIQDIEQDPLLKSFRSCKYEIKLSQKSLNVLKRYLAKQGHLIILQIIQFWFNIIISDAIKQNDDIDDVLLSQAIDDDDDINLGESQYTASQSIPVPTPIVSNDENILNEFKIKPPSPKFFIDNSMDSVPPPKVCVCPHTKKIPEGSTECNRCKLKRKVYKEKVAKVFKQTKFYALKVAEETIQLRKQPIRVMNISNSDHG